VRRVSAGRLVKWLLVLVIALMGMAAILVLLAALVLPRVIGRTAEARRTLTIVQMRTLMTALEQYRIDNNAQVPSTDQGLLALIDEPVRGPMPRLWRGPYLAADAVPTDGWGNEYRYAVLDEGRDYRLWSLGADDAPGGSGEAADIRSWEPETWADG
jgi:general secretion pathway protein G